VETPVNNMQNNRSLPATARGLRASGSSRGYTLLELLIALFIIALLGTMVGPNMMGVIERNRKASALGDSFAMLGMARSEAVNAQTTVSICPSLDQATCSGTAWEKGWILFIDDGAGVGGTEGDGDVNGTEQLLRVGQAATGDVTVRTRNFADAGAITFELDGMVEDNGTIVICDDNGPALASAVVLNVSGQARMAGDDDGNGTLDEDDGSEVSTCP